MAVFKAFKPEAMNKIAKAMGYSGDMGQFQDFVEQDPARQARMEQFKNAAVQMAKGGAVQRANVVKMREGGFSFGAQPLIANQPISSSFLTIDPRGPIPGSTTGKVAQVNPKTLDPDKGYAQVVEKKIEDEFGNIYDSEDEYRSAMAGTVTRTFKKDGKETKVKFVRGKAQSAIPEGAEEVGTGEATYKDFEIPDPRTKDVTRDPTIADVSAQRLSDPRLPKEAVTKAAQITAKADQDVDTETGQIDAYDDIDAATQETVAKATAGRKPDLAKVEGVQKTADDVAEVADETAAQTLKKEEISRIEAEQQYESSVSDIDAETGTAIKAKNEVTRELQDGEIVDAAFNAEKAAQFAEKIQAAEATPSKKATVRGQLEDLMTDFEGGETPVWAAGAMRAATQAMASRGLGASSMAGQAIIQATMESAIPIAQADASRYATFEQQNLSNRQQRAMLAAEQRAAFIGQEFDQEFQARVFNSTRIGEVANQNFTAEQQVQLENSRAANTMNMQNLSNKQALVMAEAAALADLDRANLNNRQQAAVQNAQNFLQVDMANLNNQQQVELFKSQQRIQSIFNDAASENARRQFNATSENQLNQFFANMQTQVSQYNASQTNAQQQFNAGQKNAMSKFNREVDAQRDQFNATNKIAIAQNNAQWRRQIATANTAAVNRANEINAAAVLDISNDSYNNLWNHYSDTMEWAWTSAEAQLDRYNQIALEQLRQDKALERTNIEAGSAAGSAIGNLLGSLGTAFFTAKFCWVAREVYGPANPDWLIFREWMFNKAPKWFFNLYAKYGERVASFISNKPALKFVIRKMMDRVVKNGN